MRDAERKQLKSRWEMMVVWTRWWREVDDLKMHYWNRMDKSWYYIPGVASIFLNLNRRVEAIFLNLRENTRSCGPNMATRNMLSPYSYSEVMVIFLYLYLHWVPIWSPTGFKPESVSLLKLTFSSASISLTLPQSLSSLLTLSLF